MLVFREFVFRFSASLLSNEILTVRWLVRSGQVVMMLYHVILDPIELVEPGYSSSLRFELSFQLPSIYAKRSFLPDAWWLSSHFDSLGFVGLCLQSVIQVVRIRCQLPSYPMKRLILKFQNFGVFHFIISWDLFDLRLFLQSNFFDWIWYQNSLSSSFHSCWSSSVDHVWMMQFRRYWIRSIQATVSCHFCDVISIWDS